MKPTTFVTCLAVAALAALQGCKSDPAPSDPWTGCSVSGAGWNSHDGDALAFKLGEQAVCDVGPSCEEALACAYLSGRADYDTTFAAVHADTQGTTCVQMRDAFVSRKTCESYQGAACGLANARCETDSHLTPLAGASATCCAGFRCLGVEAPGQGILGTCTACAPDLAPCTYDLDCCDGVCADRNESGVGRCSPLSAAQPCAFDRQCASGTCRDGACAAQHLGSISAASPTGG